jgi:surface polysaccharide O-acyltransferase-like enzyme
MKQKRIDFELMRLIAIVLVVFNHTQNRGFLLYQVPEVSRVNFVLSLLMAVTCKVAVPLFFLISGGLLLHRDEPIQLVLKRRVLRMLLVLVLFSGMMYFVWTYYGYITEPGIGNFLKTLWSSGVSIPYWYLYAYTAILLLLPLLRPMVQHLPDRGFVYLFGLHLVFFGLLAPLMYALGFGTIHEDFSLPLAEQPLFFFLMGYYLAHRFDWEQVRPRALFCLTVCACVSIVLTALYWAKTGAQDTCLISIPVFAVYAGVHQLIRQHPPGEKLRKLLVTLGSCVFGAYLLEGVLRLMTVSVYDTLVSRIHVLPACCVWVLVVVLCGLGLTWCLKKLPGLRQLL